MCWSSYPGGPTRKPAGPNAVRDPVPRVWHADRRQAPEQGWCSGSRWATTFDPEPVGLLFGCAIAAARSGLEPGETDTKTTAPGGGGVPCAVVAFIVATGGKRFRRSASRWPHVDPTTVRGFPPPGPWPDMERPGRRWETGRPGRGGRTE